MKPIEGRAWLFGDDISTDLMAPGLYFKAPMDVMARHCLEAADPAFAAGVQPGDILVAGRNFGMGSAREQAAMALKHLGVGAVIALSYGRIFYRNALNFGLPALVIDSSLDVAAGDRLRVDPATGHLENHRTGAVASATPIPAHLQAMVAAGGLMPWLKRRLEEERS